MTKPFNISFYAILISSSPNNFHQKASIAPSVSHPLAPRGPFPKIERRSTPSINQLQATNPTPPRSATSEPPLYPFLDPKLHLITLMFFVRNLSPPSHPTTRPLLKPGSLGGSLTGSVEIQPEKRTSQPSVHPIYYTIWTTDKNSGQPGPIPPSKQHHYLGVNLSSIFSSGLKTKNKNAPESLATIMESRFSNFRAEGSSQELQRLTAPTSRFFNKTIFTLIYNGHISQEGLPSQSNNSPSSI